jgi:hypothetical protein
MLVSLFWQIIGLFLIFLSGSHFALLLLFFALAYHIIELHVADWSLHLRLLELEERLVFLTLLLVILFLLIFIIQIILFNYLPTTLLFVRVQ